MLNFSIRPGSNSAAIGSPNIATATLLSRNFAGTLKNVMLDGTAYGSYYHYNGTWVMGEMGLMFYSTESTAVLENVVFAPKFTDRGLQRAITMMGRYLVKNFFMIGEDQNALCGGWGGSHFEASVALTTSNLKDLAANLAYIGFDSTDICSCFRRR